MPDSLRTDASPLPRALRVGLVLAWMAFIFALSSIQDPGVPQPLTTPGHAVLYFVLGALLCEALLPGRLPGRAIALAVLVASAYGVSDELHQALVPSRTPDVLDWAWDTLGAALGAATWFLLRSRFVRRHR